ncbi:MAG: response regulator [Campylobacterales bacterium]|nr:response regulator [Campylobacterales bacterium]
MKERVPTLVKHRGTFIDAKSSIVKQWLSYKTPSEILELHQIDTEYFVTKYASGVFDYFMGVIAGEMEIGNCPIMQELLTYLKVREISADELFELCSHFRRSMVDFSYDADLNSKELFDEISYIFDKNFRGILKFYTETIFQKLIDARQEALQAGQAKEYFLSNMSHEIRTPLNAILGFVNLLIEEDISKKHKNYLDIILNSGENLLSIMNDILDFSKLRSGEFTIEPKLFSIHEELNHTLELFVASANTKEITLTSFINPDMPKELYGDALRIKQIISNFLSNAIKFTPVKGHIHLEAQCQGTELLISVKDSGVGIAKDEIESIFSAFVQAKNTTFAEGGTGLGLSISNQLAELMGGSVAVESVVGEGSLFSVIVPIEVHNRGHIFFENMQEYRSLSLAFYMPLESTFRHDAFLRYADSFGMDIQRVQSFEENEFDIIIFVDQESSRELYAKIIESGQKAIALMNTERDDYIEYENIAQICYPLYCSKLHTAFEELLHPKESQPRKERVAQKFIGHILVAEDNEANQELIKIVLKRYGLSFDLARNGLEAFELFIKGSYDLVLMDEQMPVMDGNQTVNKILSYEKEHALRHTPVAALTANVIKGAKERGLLSGYDAFLGKPIVLKDLERVFASYLRFNTSNTLELQEDEDNSRSIAGLDEKKLKEALMLSSEELVMLLSLFIKKMDSTIPELQNAIIRKDYKKIALLAHSIKGSSGNFRIESVQKYAAEMEEMAKEENVSYDFEKTYLSIKKRIEQIIIL